MRAMVLSAPGASLQMQERANPMPGDGEIRVKVSACGVCRTDLYVVDAELPGIKYPIIPGHEIVGRIDLVGNNVTTRQVDDRDGIPWLGHTCGVCRFCKEGMENLCDNPLFTGYTRDGSFATHTIADARSVYAFTRSGDTAAQDFGRRLGAVWAGASDQLPDTPLDAAIIYAPAGELAPAAVRKGGRVVCAGIHMSDIPSFPYSLLWEERQPVSVADLTRQDGRDFLKIVPQAGIRAKTTAFPLSEANKVLQKLRTGQILGAAVLQL